MSVSTHTQPGFWMGLAIATLMYVNAVRTVVDPVGFAVYMGLPVKAPESIPWVRVYGLRALFIALLVTYLLLRADPESLKWVALFGVPLALGDAWLVRNGGGRTASRHLAIAALLLLAAFAMHHWQFVVRGA
jgi:hypothetical protein